VGLATVPCVEETLVEKIDAVIDRSLRLENELRRLANGPSPDEKPGGIGTVRFLVRCPVETGEVLAKAKSVLKVVDEAVLAGWPINQQLAPKLPKWFIDRCAPQKTREEADQWHTWWKGLPPDEQTRVSNETDWSLSNWLYWLEPANRQWFWCDAKVLEDYDHIALAIKVEAWPFPWGALGWLFRAAGASDVEAEE